MDDALERLEQAVRMALTKYPADPEAPSHRQRVTPFVEPIPETNMIGVFLHDDRKVRVIDQQVVGQRLCSQFKVSVAGIPADDHLLAAAVEERVGEAMQQQRVSELYEKDSEAHYIGEPLFSEVASV